MLETTQFCDEVKPFQRSNHNLSCVLSSLFMVTSHFETKDHYMNEQLVKSPCLYGVLSPCFHDSSIFAVFDLHFWYAKPPMFERLKTIHGRNQVASRPRWRKRCRKPSGKPWRRCSSRWRRWRGPGLSPDASRVAGNLNFHGGFIRKTWRFFVGSLGCRMGIWWVYHIYIYKLVDFMGFL
jgi:hypothetical protein